MLVKRVYFKDFLEEFERFGRGDQFSYEGKKALFAFLDELGEDTGEPIELDVISLCCNFTEYDSVEEFNRDYGYSIGHDMDSIEDIEYFTLVIPLEGEGFIIQDFWKKPATAFFLLFFAYIPNILPIKKKPFFRLVKSEHILKKYTIYI